MSFSKKPKTPQMSGNAQADLAAAQRAASADARKIRLPDLEQPRFSPPSSETAVDVAARERLAKQQMGQRKGIPYSINPTGNLLG